MNVFLYSIYGAGLTLVPSIRAEGNDVIVFIKNKDAQKIGDGMVFKTDDPEAIADQADLIIFDENGAGYVADRWRDRGLNVWNGGGINDMLEYDRVYGMKIFAENGVVTPDTWEVSTGDEIGQVVKQHFDEKDRVVIKIDGESGAGSSFSYVACDPIDLMKQVGHWEEDGLLEKRWSGIIQRFVDGIEVSIEGWFNGEIFTNHNVTIEEKKQMSGDLGPAVGCAFNVVFPVAASSRLSKLVLDPLAKFLKTHSFLGQIDVNSIVDASGVPHALEFTPRCGYDATPTLCWGYGDTYANLVMESLGLEDSRRPEPKSCFQAGVRVSVPPYPFESKSDELSRKVYSLAEGVPFENYDDIATCFAPYDLMRTEAGVVIAGSCGIAGVALGCGETPKEAGLAAYKTADQVKLPNKAYRAIDGWKRAQEDIESLVKSKLIRLN